MSTKPLAPRREPKSLVSSNRCLAVFLFVALSGCGRSEFASLTGKVTLDGQPLPTAVITFISTEGGTSGYANVEPNGKYVAKSGSDTGLRPGNYRISVVANRPEVITDRKEAKTPQPITPARYADPATSGFEYKLSESGGTYDLDLTSK
jgi:hypothetical protein